MNSLLVVAIFVKNLKKQILQKGESSNGKIFLTAGLGGMSGAQPKAGNIAGCITVCAEVNPKAATKRFEQGWVDELIDDIDKLIVKEAYCGKKITMKSTIDCGLIYKDIGLNFFCINFRFLAI